MTFQLWQIVGISRANEDGKLQFELYYGFWFIYSTEPPIPSFMPEYYIFSLKMRFDPSRKQEKKKGKKGGSLEELTKG